jgi:hypothetical protein
VSLLVKGGITKLSELTIDTSKDWGAYLIKNLGVAVDDADALRKAQAILESLLTTQGDIIHRGASKAERLGGNYGMGYNFLHCINTGQFGVEWMDVEDLIIYLTGAVNRAIALPSLVIPTPDISLVVAEDHSGGGHTATPPSLAIPVPTIVAPTMVTISPQAVGGGIAHDDDPPTDTDETTQTNDATVNDMHLLPSPGAVGDGFYFGLSDPFDWLCLNIGTPGVGTWTITWKYWNGTTWTALPLKYDETNHFRAAAGKRWVHLDGRPGDWATTTILTYTLYFIKGEITSYTSMTTQPLGTQAWIGRYT